MQIIKDGHLYSYEVSYQWSLDRTLLTFARPKWLRSGHHRRNENTPTHTCSQSGTTRTDAGRHADSSAFEPHIADQTGFLRRRGSSALIGTVDNHGNTEITETVIFVKCRECRDFAKMPRFCRVFLPKCCNFTFSQEYFVFNQHILKFIV